VWYIYFFRNHNVLPISIIIYCGIFAPWKNCWVTETSKHALNNRITSVYSSMLGQWNHITGATWDVFCVVGANQQYNWVFCAWSVQRLYNATLIIFRIVQFSSKRGEFQMRQFSSRWGDVNAVTVVVQLWVNNSRGRSTRTREHCQEWIVKTSGNRLKRL
jgi:hypothetical protein